MMPVLQLVIIEFPVVLLSIGMLIARAVIRLKQQLRLPKQALKSWTDWFNVFKNKKYDDIFSAKNMKLLNGDEKFEMPSKNDDVVCKPRFYTTDKTLFDKFVNGEEKMTLKIELARNQSKTFLVDVKNKTISGTI